MIRPAPVGIPDHRAELRSDQLPTTGFYSFTLTTLGTPSRLSDNHAAYRQNDGGTDTSRGSPPRRQKTQTATSVRYMSAEERSATHSHRENARANLNPPEFPAQYAVRWPQPFCRRLKLTGIRDPLFHPLSPSKQVTDRQNQQIGAPTVSLETTAARMSSPSRSVHFSCR